MSSPTFAERAAAFARFNPEHVKRRLDCLAHNLAIGAGLCQAHQIGLDAADEMMPSGLWPGCGWIAP